MFPIIPANSVADSGKEGIFGFGVWTAVTNLVSNAGVVATDTVGVGTARYYLAACSFN